METFLRRFALIVSGVLSGFDRVVFKGRLPQLYSPEGMNCYVAANHVQFVDFKSHAKAVTKRVMDSSRVEWAKANDRYRFLSSSRESKDEAAKAILAKRPVTTGLAAVLQCVEPCWTFDTKTEDGRLTIVGEPGKCSSLYHYYRHPVFGWMYIRLQTWFPFEVQIGLNGREWLASRMEREGMKYQRSDNKFLHVADWSKAQTWLDEQQQTNWVTEFDALVKEVHPLHPGHLGRLPHSYNWTVHQSEWATDVAFRSRAELEAWYPRWTRYAFTQFDSVQAMRFLGRSGRLPKNGTADVHSDVKGYDESVRIKHVVNGNSVKMYDHGNVLRVETTINQPKEFRSYRSAVGDPQGPKSWRVMRRSVADTHRRAAVSQAANERYLEALSAVAATTTVAEVASPWCERVADVGGNGRTVRGLNPWATADAALLAAVSDPKWTVNGLRNRDLAEAIFGKPPTDPTERKRRSAKVGRLIRLLRSHGILKKVSKTNRYQVCPKSKDGLLAVLATRSTTPEKLTALAA